VSNKINNKTRFLFTDDTQQGVDIQDLSIIPIDLNKDFSFKMVDSNIELLDNPNILDNAKFTKNSGLELNNTFDDIQDPIFDLDEDLPVIDKKPKIQKERKINLKIKSVPTARYK
jgi:hypothetical protein